MAHQTAVDIIRVISEAVNPTGQFAYLRTWDASLEFNEVDQKIFLYPISGQVDITNGYFETWTCSMGFFFQDAPDSTNEQREQLITNADVLLKAFILAADTVDGVQFSIVRKRPVYRDMAGTYSGYLVDFTLSLTEDICNGDTPSVIIPVGKTFCELVDECLGISPTGSNTKYLNEKGLWTTPAGGGGGSYTFGNGLTETNNDVKLGGALTEDTTIEIDSFLMEFTTKYGHNLIFTDNFLGAGYNFAGISHNDSGVIYFNGVTDFGGVEYSGLGVINKINSRSSQVIASPTSAQIGFTPNSASPNNLNSFVSNSDVNDIISEDSDATKNNTKFSYANGDGTTTKVAQVYRDGAMANDSGFYIGDKTTDGSWRFVTSGADLVIQKREAGNWVTKQTLI